MFSWVSDVFPIIVVFQTPKTNEPALVIENNFLGPAKPFCSLFIPACGGIHNKMPAHNSAIGESNDQEITIYPCVGMQGIRDVLESHSLNFFSILCFMLTASL